MGEGGFALPKNYIFHLFLPKIIFHLSNDNILPLQISYFVFPEIIVLLSKDCILSFQKYWFVSSNQKVWFAHSPFILILYFSSRVHLNGLLLISGASQHRLKREKASNKPLISGLSTVDSISSPVDTIQNKVSMLDDYLHIWQL